MADNREVEIKLELDGKAYEGLLSSLGTPARKLVQENHFLDTADRKLSGLKWAFRIRIEETTAFLTAKGPAQKQGAAMIRPEIEDEIPAALAKGMLEGVSLSDRSTHASISQLHRLIGDRQVVEYLGFTNLRLCYGWEDRELLIDKTRILDRDFYELETDVEPSAISAVEAKLKAWFGKNGWGYQSSKISKLERALEMHKTIYGK
jgi:uncharacterized protein YjbK